jgi:ATP-dependent RNA helicase RhlB
MLTKSVGTKALIMVPTRELAVQVEEEAKVLCSASNLKAYSFFGGVGYEKQVSALKKGVDIIIGTPGRLIDLCEGNNLDLSAVSYLVVDEADRMFDMGFYPDLRKLLKVLPASENRQTMLFSATLNSYVKNLAWEYTRDPIEITIEAENITVSEIQQELLHVSSDEKMKLLIGVLKHDNPESVIIFCNTKRSCEVVAKRLQMNDIKCDFLIGDLPQSKRLQILKEFKAGQIKVLVATDVAARGIDVTGVTHIYNYDIPETVESYIHRIGRCGRAGEKGYTCLFIDPKNQPMLDEIEKTIKFKIPKRHLID